MVLSFTVDALMPIFFSSFLYVVAVFCGLLYMFLSCLNLQFLLTCSHLSFFPVLFCGTLWIRGPVKNSAVYDWRTKPAGHLLVINYSHHDKCYKRRAGCPGIRGKLLVMNKPMDRAETRRWLCRVNCRSCNKSKSRRLYCIHKPAFTAEIIETSLRFCRNDWAQ
jgi:hypothetical protein